MVGEVEAREGAGIFRGALAGLPTLPAKGGADACRRLPLLLLPLPLPQAAAPPLAFLGTAFFFRFVITSHPAAVSSCSIPPGAGLLKSPGLGGREGPNMALREGRDEGWRQE